MKNQLCSHILMVRPSNFGFNPETALNNSFQKESTQNPTEIAKSAMDEFDDAVDILLEADVDIMVVQDSPDPIKPDAIFPNNWLSMLHGGHVHLFPMFSDLRMAERRMDVIELVNKKFAVNTVKDWYQEGDDSRALEGTGSMVFDHINELAFACESERTQRDLLTEFCRDIGYEPLIFNALDEKGKAIYHTNVMMSIGEDFALYCAESIWDPDQVKLVRNKLHNSRQDIIEISYEQMNAFGANILQFKNRKNEKCIALSATAFNNLSSAQRRVLESHGHLLIVPIQTIEKIGGGSIRCMIAEVFFNLR